MDLVIVESPAKAKTIEGFLGKGFVVKSSYGHVRDLASKGIAIDVEHDFAPDYEVMPDKKSVISDLKKLVKKSDKVWLATDEDREGEAIAWHLYEVLGLKPANTERIVFNEITKPAITKAIENPRTINNDLVNAQQARRVLDRLVGFEISPVLWRKVKPSLSAGRVQSVTVRLIVEREREILGFKAESSYRVVGEFISKDGKHFTADLSERFTDVKKAKAFLEGCAQTDYTVSKVNKKPAKRTPAAPFTTSTLQQEASRKLGFSVSQTMAVAQRLYEAGKITYMRTDSVNLSDTALSGAQEEINSHYGTEYHKLRKYSSKAKGAQEAHEAIRPTYFNQTTVQGERNEQRLYDLIWKRTIASQMADAKLERTQAIIDVAGQKEHFEAKGEVVVFDGFLKVYTEGKDDDSQDQEMKGMLPHLGEGDQVTSEKISATERFTHHPPRYTEASLVKKLEELGIGRPSTYAPTISTVQRRGYVEKKDLDGRPREYHQLTLENGLVDDQLKTENTGAERKKLFPTDIGMVVNDFLVDHFTDVLDYNFTASVEKEFDHIADGELQWQKMIAKFYKGFHDEVEETLEHGERATGERKLGQDPESGEPVIVRIGRFGPMAQIGEQDEEKKPRFASLRAGQSIATITLEEALDLFKLPRDLGLFEEKKVVIGVGRFGPYVRHDSKFVSIPKEMDPLSITLDESVQLIKEKREKDAKALIKTFPEDDTVRILEGRWGPYIKHGKKNVKIPKDVEAASLTLEECLELSEKQPEKGKKTAAKKATAKKTTAKKKTTTKKKTTAKKTTKAKTAKK